jgi:hypothetical protein
VDVTAGNLLTNLMRTAQYPDAITPFIQPPPPPTSPAIDNNLAKADKLKRAAK